MKRKKGLPVFLLGITAALFLALLTHAPSRAAEIRYPVPCYEGEELAKVRAWEKEWVGKKITPANIDGVKEFLPEVFYNIFTDTEKWGEYWFEIVPYKQIKPTTGNIKFSMESKSSIGPDEGLLNYVAGAPFPNPKTPLEIVYNFDNVSFGDNFRDHTDLVIVDGRRRYNRDLGVNEHWTYFSARTDVPPVPEFPNNVKDMWQAYHVEYTAPASFKGMRAMTVRWNDRTRDFGSWQFSPSSRRVFRRSVAQRQTHIGPSDLTYNDQGVYNWVINQMNYTLAGKKELLTSRQTDVQDLLKNDQEGMCYVSGFKRERINAYVIKSTHKDPNYMYKKQVWYVDPEHLKAIYAEKYDNQGKLWKYFEMTFGTYKSAYDGQDVLRFVNQTVIDVQRIHGTKAYFTNQATGEQGLGLQYDYFSPKALLQYGY